MNKKILTNQSGGYVVILNVLFFAVITFLLSAAIITPLVASNQSAVAFTRSTQAFMVGNSAVEEALYRLKNSYDLPASETLVLGNATATLSVSSGSDEKTVRVDTETEGYFRNIELLTSTGPGVSFNFGIQSGRGGFRMSGSATVNGNVYSNGDIIGSGGPSITGSAFVANQSDPVAHVSSGGPIPPSNQVDFGGNATPQDMAQSFTVSTTSPMTAVRLYIMRTTTAWMNDVTLRIVEDKNGHPDGGTLASAVISMGQVTTAFNYLSVPLSTQLNLTPGSTYWIVLDTNTSWGGYYVLAAAPDAYANGVAKTGSWQNGNGGSWNDATPSTLDSYFDVYVGGDTGLLEIVKVGQNGGDAWAHEAVGVTVYDNLFCQAGGGQDENNAAVVCDTSRPDPVEQPFPISEGNILDWKAEAALGTTTVGDVTYGNDDVVELGPGVIDGDLYAGSGAVVTINGTLYVTGDITVTGGAVVKLSTSYGTDPGVIVSDGKISMLGGGLIQGNGLSNSFVLALTTSTCPDDPSCGGDPAIQVSGGTDSVILNAQSGTIDFAGGSEANQATGYTIIMSGGTELNYVSGLEDVNFTSGPAGSWTIDGWQEI